MKNFLVLLVLAVAALAAATWFMAGPERDATQDLASSDALGAHYDYYVQDMLATRFGADGQPVSQLRAERVRHFPADDRAELVMPAFDAFGAPNEAWHVDAAAGTLSPDPERGGDRLDLAGMVQLRKPQAGGNYVEVDTEALTVFIDSEEAYSDVAVVVRTRTSRLNGNGLQARLADNHIQITNGSGTHVPTSNP